jgi:predicted small lipoprotein YifL
LGFFHLCGSLENEFTGFPMTRTFVIVVIALSLTAPLSACGRRGALEAPSASANPPATAQQAPVEDKPFVLDGLIE